MYKVLVVDDDQGLRLSVRQTLEIQGSFSVFEASNGQEALDRIQTGDFDLVFLDVDMPVKDGFETLIEIKKYNPAIAVIMITAYASIENAIQAVKEGAYNYLSKPIQGETLLQLTHKCLEAHSLVYDVTASSPRLALQEGRELIGETYPMKKVFYLIQKLAQVDTPVFIRGDSGTGKELVARALHFNSPQKEGPFVALNCSAIPENIFESELFGHEKGAFTGADQRKIGRFQFAEGGTLFLDEIGDLPLSMQAKLLRVLQEKIFTPVGSNREIHLNARVVTATNRPLEDMMTQGLFRDDLYYRLNVMPLFLPALKERTHDLEHISQLFIKKFNKKHNKNIRGLSVNVLRAFEKYNWPGNIRELENVIEFAFIVEESPVIELMSLPEGFLKSLGIKLNYESPQNSFSKSNLPNSSLQFPVETEDFDFTKHKEAFEKDFIIRALKKFKGKINQTSLHANIPKKTLLRKIEKYQIRARDFSETKLKEEEFSI